MSDSRSAAKHAFEDLHSRSEATGAPSPGVEDGVLRFPRSPEQAAHAFSMLHGGVPEVGVDEYRDIREACGSASELSTQLLSISGRRWHEPPIVDLRALVSGMDLGRFFSNDVVFCTDFAAVTCPVRVDPTHLQKVVLGLVLNAREAVGGRGTVRVGIDHLPGMKIEGRPGKEWVQLEVSDSGWGPDRETLRSVFHPFSSTRPFSEVQGLGLSVACGIVRQSGGTMKVSSAPCCGTTVRVRLPATASGSSSDDAPERAGRPETPPARPPRSRPPSFLGGRSVGSPTGTALPAGG